MTEQFQEPEIIYQTPNLIFKEDVFEIVGICMEIHRILRKGFQEIVYKDAMEYEFKKRNREYAREKKFEISYKDTILPHYYIADFVFDDKIILEVKAQQQAVD